MRKPITLRRAVTLSVLSIGLFTCPFGLAYVYWQAKYSMRETIGNAFQELARQGSDKVGLILDKEIEWVERLSMLPEVRHAVRKGTSLSFAQQGLHRWKQAQRGYFRSMVVLDRRGFAVGGITSESTHTHYTMQPWWPVVFEKQQPWAGDFLVDEAGHGYWEVAVPIVEDKQMIIGALKVVIATDELFASILQRRIGQTGHMMLLEGHGTVVTCPIRPPSKHTSAASWLPSVAGIGHPVEARWLEVPDDTHGKGGGIVGVAPVSLRPNIAQAPAWYILVRQDPGETYAPLHILMWKLSAFGVLVLAGVALLRRRLARRIVQPINALVERVRQLGHLRHTERPIRAPRADIVEIDALADSFDELTERLERASRDREHYVADLERANAELVTSEQHYRMLWNHSADMKLLVDRKGIIRDVNRRGEIKLWKHASRLIGTPVENLFHEEERAGVRRLLGDVVATSKEVPAGEKRLLSPTEGIFIMDVDMVPVEDSGSLVAVMLQLSDLTEKIRLEEQLVRSERLASLSQFASLFAHDIRNPLVGIKKTLELLSHRPELQTDPYRQWFEDMRFTTDLLLGMINDMLDVYQHNYSGLPLLTSTLSVNVLVDEVTHLFRTEASAKGVTFRVEAPEEDVSVTADGRRLLRVLINLVHNALKFSPPGGVITLSLREDRQTVRSGALGMVQPAVVTIQVADEGPGIAPQDLPHVFEMFFRKNDDQEMRLGRGLGLHFCRLVVEAHHGRISAGNRSSGGAILSVELPVEQKVYVGQSADR